MSVCENAIADCTGLAGCGGRLCRNMRHSLSKMDFIRYRTDEMGETDTSENPVKGVLCGFITKLRAPSDPSCAVPGIMGDASNVRLTVVSSGMPLEVGDIVSTGEKSYCVQSQLSELPVRFSLLERAVPDEAEI